jgi:bla regulator protein BlaR1
MPFALDITDDLLPEKSFIPAPLAVDGSQSEITPAQAALEQGETEITVQTRPITFVDWNTVLTGIYLLGLILFFIRFVLQSVRLTRLIRTNLTIKEDECTYVLLSHKTLPFTFLNFLFVEKGSFEEKALEKEILLHEWTHIRQKHSWDILLVEILRIAFWFHPLLLLYKRAIQLNHEFLADAAVTTKFQDKTSYQWLLLHKASLNQAGLSISSPFNFSSTKSRLIMMGKSSSSLKTRLLKASSFVIAGVLTFVLSSSQPFTSTDFQSTNNFEQILSKAFKDGNPYEVELNKLDLHALRDAYLALDENEKYTGTEFPFFEEVTFGKLVELQQAYPKVKTKILFESPPERKEIQNDVFEQWKKTKHISVTMDEIEIEKSDLNSYQPADFALFRVRATETKGLFKRTAYQVTLMTNDYYFGKYLEPKKRIELIESEYPDGEKVAVTYGTKHSEAADGKITNPENYEASIFHQLRVIVPSELKWEFRNPIAYEPSKSFSIVISSNEGRQLTLMKLPTI